MDRFVAFRWDRRNGDAAALVDRWVETLRSHGDAWTDVLTGAGLRVLARPRSDGRLPVMQVPDAGVAVGTIFERGQGSHGPIATLPPDAFQRLVMQDASAKGSPYWGQFIAFLHDAATGDLHVTRDPSGAAPCFVLRSHNVDLLFALPDDVSGLPGLTLSIDWTAVHAFLVHSFFITRHTGLREVREILPGERLGIRADGSTTSAWTWTPASFAATRHRLRFDEAREELRAITRDSFAAWGRSCRKIAVRLSGGLDSSVVAGAMREASTADMVGVHIIGQGYEAHERRLARLAGKQAGMELLELEITDTTADLSAILTAPKLARPSMQLLGAFADRAISETCHTLDCDSIMTGHGGDTLFLPRGIATDVLVDHVRLHGLRDIWKKAYEVAVLLQAPVWHVLRHTVSRLLSTTPWNPLSMLDDPAAPCVQLGMAQGARGLPSEYTHHDWLATAARLPPCKAEQIRGVTALRNYHPLLSNGIAFAAIQPLISQPIIEFCLATPAPLLVEGGTDRALERAAFRDCVPAEITRRFEKGFINHQLTRDLARNAATIRDFLVEGHVVARSLVSRDAVHALFGEGETLPAGRLAPLLGLLAAEAWVTSWACDAGIS